MKSLAELNALASSMDFRPGALEKILKLLRILERLDDNELSHAQWVLKGGTAINLFHLNVPRLSVDIDLNFVGVVDVEELKPAREVFERVLTAACAREGCSLKRAPFEHAGGKFRLRYASLLGGEQNLEVDVSYVARVPIWGVERRSAQLSGVQNVTESPVLRLSELAAGKFTALLARGAPRDVFDAMKLIELWPSLCESPEFRVAFVTQVASSRDDLRKRELPSTLRPTDVETQLLPLLRRGSDEEYTAATLPERLDTFVRPALETAVNWSQSETRFLGRLLDEGELEPEHLTDAPAIRTRISQQPMLLWKQKHIRQHKGLNET